MRRTFLDSMAIVKDFWAEPSYATLLLASQKRLHDYVVAGQGTAKEALDSLVADWTETFERRRQTLAPVPPAQSVPCHAWHGTGFR